MHRFEKGCILKNNNEFIYKKMTFPTAKSKYLNTIAEIHQTAF